MLLKGYQFMIGQGVYDIFYKIPRLGGRFNQGYPVLSDGGGPFGFDISKAIEFDYIVRSHRCDAIIELGSHAGDTTEYLGRYYCDLPVLSCDISEELAAMARDRCIALPNVSVSCCPSVSLIEKVLHSFDFPAFYLDAHGHGPLPLKAEIDLIRRGAVVIDDVNVGRRGFGFDTYDGVELSLATIARWMPPEASTLFASCGLAEELGPPVVQGGRRSSIAAYVVGMSERFSYCRYFESFVQSEYPHRVDQVSRE